MPSPPENVQLLWGLRRSLRERDNDEAAREKLSALQGLREDLGLPGMPLVSAALAAEACEAQASGGGRLAAEASHWATVLSPLEAGPHWSALNIAVAAGFRPAAALKHLVAWVRLSLADRLERRRLGAEALLLGYAAALLAALSLLAVGLRRHVRVAAHGLSHFLPVGTSERQRELATVLLFVATPVLLPLGLLGVLLGWSLVLWRYLSLPERAVALLAVLLIGAAPVVVRPLDRQLAEPGSVRAAAYRVQHRGPYPGDLALLRETLAAEPEHGLVRFTLALDAKRSGRVYDAVKLLRPLIAGGEGAPAARLLGAVLDLAQHRPSAARATLQKLTAGPRASFAARFNLYRIAQAQGTPDVTELLAAAQAHDADAADAIIAADHPGINRLLAEQRTPPERILRSFWAPPRGASRFFPVVAPLLLGLLDPSSAPIASGVAVALLIVLGFVLRRWPGVHPCARCGQPLCPRCHTLVGRTRHCEGCTPGFVLLDGQAILSSAVVDDQRRRAVMGRRHWAVVLNLLLPGAGLHLYGFSARGSLLMAAWWLVLLRWATFGGVFRTPLVWGHTTDYAAFGLLAIASLAVWSLGQLMLRWSPDGEWV